jgi:hypothetical protein
VEADAVVDEPDPSALGQDVAGLAVGVVDHEVEQDHPTQLREHARVAPSSRAK